MSAYAFALIAGAIKLQLGRSTWHFRRDGLSLELVYRDLENGQDHYLGAISPGTSDDELLRLFAEHYHAYMSPSDWVVLNQRVLVVAADRGVA